MLWFFPLYPLLKNHNVHTLDQLKKKLEACEARLTVIDVTADEIEEGLVLKIKELDGNTMDVWQNYYNDHLEDKIDISKTGSPSRMLIAISLVDQGGTRCFSPKDTKSHHIVGKMPSVVQDRVAVEAYRLNKMRKEDRDELAKNSQATQEEDFGSI